MKRILALVFMYGVSSSVTAAAAPKAAPFTAAQKKAHDDKLAAALYATMAPADEYFGPLKLSIIGISNTIRDIGLRYKYNNSLAAPSFASAQLVESAVRDWAHRYAHDPQLPRNVYYLQRLYTQIAYQKSRDRAAVVAQWMAVTFPTSAQERQLKKTLATEHLAPLASPTPSPTPSTQPGAEPGAPFVLPTATGTPAPAGAPYASPAPLFTPFPPAQSATPTARPIPQASPEPAGAAAPVAAPTAAESPAAGPPR